MALRYLKYAFVVFCSMSVYGQVYGEVSAHAQVRKERYEQSPQFRQCVQFVSVDARRVGESSSPRQLCSAPTLRSVYSNANTRRSSAFESCARFMANHRTGEARSPVAVCASEDLLTVYTGRYVTAYQSCMNGIKTGAQTVIIVPSSHCYTRVRQQMQDEDEVMYPANAGDGSPVVRPGTRFRYERPVQ